MPLVNPAPLVYQTISNQIDFEEEKNSKGKKNDIVNKGLLTRSFNKQSDNTANTTEISRVMRYMKYIRGLKKELTSNG